ncbi:hypothetical protein FFI94_033240 [Rhodococcus sp. KBS0724]|uniref:hypothetical protein n=1 Tax=Rhodococcus sp. KBS0724 TaxID=1179674 RepID=UPI00110DDAC0|nr:hypothetical protein [Rhodococcus sp. KBS0724]TSD39667.1 hypothetical protein FFI94_033240 [Rhodococcus sp. KBS0724]
MQSLKKVVTSTMLAGGLAAGIIASSVGAASATPLELPFIGGPFPNPGACEKARAETMRYFPGAHAGPCFIRNAQGTWIYVITG